MHCASVTELFIFYNIVHRCNFVSKIKLFAPVGVTLGVQLYSLGQCAEVLQKQRQALESVASLISITFTSANKVFGTDPDPDLATVFPFLKH